MIEGLIAYTGKRLLIGCGVSAALPGDESDTAGWAATG
jgi:hypothetical protein